MSWSATAFGQMCPRLKGSSWSPRIETMPPSRTSIAMPQMASQRLQARKWVSVVGVVTRLPMVDPGSI